MKKRALVLVCVVTGCSTCLFAQTPGDKKWTSLTGSVAAPFQAASYIVTSSPAIAGDGTVYVGSYHNRLYAINADGTQKWSFITGYAIDSSPAIGNDGTVYIGSRDNRLHAIYSSRNGQADSPWPKFHQNNQNTGQRQALTAVAGTHEGERLPRSFVLMRAHPNPFNPETTINFGLPKAREVELAVYNILGQKVRTLIAGTLRAGWHLATWAGKDDNGKATGSGIYILQMKAGAFVATRRITLLR